MNCAPNKYLLKMAFLAVLFMLSSCVKDVDLDQYEEIVIPTEADIDLIYLKLSATKFWIDADFNLRAEDQTNLEYLDDDYIQKSLVATDFRFEVENHFEYPVQLVVSLLSVQDAVQYQTRQEIPAGHFNSPTSLQWHEIFEGAEIEKVKKSFKIKVEALILNAGPELPKGFLELKSKAIYKFEFKT